METLHQYYYAMHDFNCSTLPSSASGSFDELNNSNTVYYNNNMDATDPSLLDPNLEPQSRQRCNTWPLRPMVNSPSVQDSESAHGDIIAEEPEPTEGFQSGSQHNLSGDNGNSLGAGALPPNNNGELGSQGDLSAAKKQSSRKNAWGNLSYADLITKAIQNSPEKRLTLSQIYDWMVQNVNYFRDKGDSNSSAGWKNSIRHNLSLHNRFMRLQNEGAGKSSWWVINPDAKPGKAPRRRGNSMDSKQGLKSKRDRVLKRVELQRKMKDNPASPAMQHSPDGFTLSPGDPYRERSCSNASSIGNSIGGRRSPLYDNDLIDNKISPWGSEDYIYEHNMDAKLPEDLEQIMKLQGDPPNSFLGELEEISQNTGAYSDSPAAPQHLYVPNKPYQSYTEVGNGYTNAPPPPYPTPEQQQQQQFGVMTNQGMSEKDPMMGSYYSNTSNNNTANQMSNQGYRPYCGNAMSANRNEVPGQGLPATTRAPPSSIRSALQGQAPMKIAQPRRLGPSNSVKQNSPLLVNQLLKYQPTSQQQVQQGLYPSQGQQMMNSQPYMYQSSQSQCMTGYELPTDIDISLDMLPVNELQCDVDQVLQQEITMDGGQLDFTGFANYSQQQQQQQQQQASQKQQSNSSQNNLGVMS